MVGRVIRNGEPLTALDLSKNRVPSFFFHQEEMERITRSVKPSVAEPSSSRKMTYVVPDSRPLR
jgi:hypothetical protein